MLTVAAAIVALAKVKASEIVKISLFDSGMVAVVALFGVAWIANTFIAANQTVIVDGLDSPARQACGAGRWRSSTSPSPLSRARCLAPSS